MLFVLSMGALLLVLFQEYNKLFDILSERFFFSAKLEICFSYIMVRTSYILMRLWCRICTRQTPLFGFSLHGVSNAYRH